jgi:excisionase family DNA binding protein
MTPIAPAKYLTLEEVAELLQVPVRAVKEWCARGELEHVRLGHKTVRSRSDWVADFVARKQGEPAAGARRSAR